jgi:hypothetical protein
MFPLRDFFFFFFFFCLDSGSWEDSVFAVLA